MAKMSSKKMPPRDAALLDLLDGSRIEGRRDRAFTAHKYTLQPSNEPLTQSVVLTLVERGLVKSRFEDELGDHVSYHLTEAGVNRAQALK